MNDLISRQAAIEALEREKTYCTAFRDGYVKKNIFEKYNMGIDDGIKALNNLPSAVKQGKWFNTSTDIPKLLMNVCSECGFQYPSAIRTRFNYCPNCGARME